jgi:RNA polymerase sigma-70 factor (ECF subfamily)
MSNQVIDDVTTELVARACAFDPDAWAELYERAHRVLFGYAYRRLGAVEAAEDAVSETMTRALQTVGRREWNGAPPEAWLMGIMRNVVYESWRRTARDDRAVTLPVPVADTPAIDLVIADEDAAEVRRAFGKLSPEDQELLELRVFAGLSADEVGSILERRPGSVRMAQHRAIARLRAMLPGADGRG